MNNVNKDSISDFDITKSVFDNWKIISKIGEGSFGTVYKIERIHQEMFSNRSNTQNAALKVITIPKNKQEQEEIINSGMNHESITEYYRDYAEKMYREIELMLPLRGHGNIVSYEDHKIIPFQNGTGWTILIRMELLVPIAEYTKTHTLSVKEVIRLGMDLCQALSACSMYHIIHRDIKPDNIFVSSFGNYKLGDFGIARTAQGRTMGTIAGTYKYMAPEVYKNSKYDETVDIYSLGLVMYQYLNNGRLPFFPPATENIKFGDDEMALTCRMSGVDIPAIAGVDSELNRIIAKACNYDPKDRYRNAKEFYDALFSYLSEQELLKKDRDDDSTIKVNPEKDIVHKPLHKNNELDKKSNHSSGKRKMLWVLLSAIIVILITSLVIGLGRKKSINIANKETEIEWEVTPTEAPAQETAEKTNKNHSLDTYHQESSNPEKTHMNQMVYLYELVNLENSDIVSYQIARDAYGQYYDYALGGKNKDIRNSCGFSVKRINDQYRYFQGSVIKNFDYKSAEGDDCVKIYLDGVCVFETIPKGKYQAEDFHIDISNASELAIIMEGANYLRIVDVAFTNSEEMISSCSSGPVFFDNIDEIFLQDESNIRTYLTVRDNEGDIYYRVLAGTTSDVINTQTYALNGQYKEFSGKALLNYDYKDIENSDVAIEIYVDDKLKYKSPLMKKGMKTENFSVDLTDANTMTIKIAGRNYARIADIKLS